MELALGMTLKFYTSVAKGLKQLKRFKRFKGLKVKKFLGLIPTFVEVTREKLVKGIFATPILNRVKKAVLSNSKI